MTRSPRGRDRSHRLLFADGGSAPCPPLTIPRGPAQGEARSRALVALDAFSLALFFALVAAVGRRLGEAGWSGRTAAVVLASAIAGYLAADLVSGVVHWLGDTFFREDTPLIGQAFIHPFREHHRDPLAITRHGFLEVNGNNCLALTPLLVPTWVLGAPVEPGDVPALWFQAAALSFSLVTFGSNQFHKWAHQPQPSRLVRRLQALGLVLSPAHHAAHHRPPHRSAYCVTVGWMNPLLDRLRVFERAERLLRSLDRGHDRLPSRRPSDRSQRWWERGVAAAGRSRVGRRSRTG